MTASALLGMNWRGLTQAPRTRSVLFFGCGDADDAREMRDRGAHATVVHLACAPLLAAVRAQGCAAEPTHHALYLPHTLALLPRAPFDAVVASLPMQSRFEMREALADIHAAMRQGGRLLVAAVARHATDLLREAGFQVDRRSPDGMLVARKRRE